MKRNSFEEINKLQEIASNPKNSAWVFASAGSGKTKILVDRVLRLLLDKIDGNKILCITFTKIAALEMRERINQILSNWVILSDPDLKTEIFKISLKNASENDLKYARTLFSKVLDGDFDIKIQTIHAFCQDIVKIFPLESKVSPKFEILDEKSEKILLEKAKKQVFKEAEFDENLKNNIFQLSSRQSEDGFFKLVAELLNQKEKLIFLKMRFFNIKNLVAKIFQELNVENFKNEQEIFEKFISEINCKNIEKIIDILEKSDKKTDLKTANSLKFFLNDKNFDKIGILQEVFLKDDLELKKISSIANKQFQDIFDEIYDLQKKVDEFFDLLNSFKIASSTKFLLEFIDKILFFYSQLKNQKSFLDYNDLIIKTNELLENQDYKEWVKFRLDGFFDHILIDESQDTNHRQWLIIKALSEDFFSGFSSKERKSSLFIIGDDKQSIYSFQGAAPNISNEIYDFYKSKTDEIKKVSLQNSFRSLPKVLEFVDLIFQENNSFKKLDYQSHKATRSGNGIIEIWPQISFKKDRENLDFKWKNYLINNQNDEEFCQKEEMANRIVENILCWIKNKRKILRNVAGVEVEKEIQFGDIMILLRNRANGFDKILQQKFEENQIAFKGVKKVKFSRNLIIQDFLALLKFALLPNDDLNLASLLKSQFFNFDEEKLLEICLFKNQEKISLFQALKLKNGFEEDFRKLENILSLSFKIDIYEFFSSLIKDEIRQKYILEFGENADLIIDQFLIEVLNFCKNQLSNLQKFYDFIEKTDPEILINEVDKNSVLISTIHSAKGLQAPIVILPDCCFSFNKMNHSKETLLWIDFENDRQNQDKLPIWFVKKLNLNKKLKFFKNIHIQNLKDEYWRLFYVALTRAENEIYISGFGNDNDFDSWFNEAQKALEKI